MQPTRVRGGTCLVGEDGKVRAGEIRTKVGGKKKGHGRDGKNPHEGVPELVERPAYLQSKEGPSEGQMRKSAEPPVGDRLERVQN